MVSGSRPAPPPTHHSVAGLVEMPTDLQHPSAVALPSSDWHGERSDLAKVRVRVRVKVRLWLGLGLG